MHRLVLCLLGVVLSFTSSVAQTVSPSDVVDSDAFLREALRPRATKDHRKEVEALLSRMTLREKIGQMTQLELGMISDGKNAELKINPAKLEKAIVEYGVGSILNVNETAYPPERWRDIVATIDAAAHRSRLRIPVVYGIDSIHGANYVLGSTLFPQPIGMAATWNPGLLERAQQVTAAETRAAGLAWNFSPGLDIGRNPLWPRLYETYGEDVYLARVMAGASVRGYEGDDLALPIHVAACLKHYVGYGVPASGQDRTVALIPETTLREYHLPVFAAGVQAGAHSVMVNSSQVNGVPVHADRHLLTDVLRGELGFQGVVVSDWEDIKKLASIHRVAVDEKDATRLAILAGVDMSMVPSDYSFSDLLVTLVNEGAVPMSRIDDAVRRIVAFKYELGLFDPPRNAAPAVPATNRQVALQAARDSITLLQNKNNVLPLARSRRLLVTGPTADSLVPLNNGWTYTWQGKDPAPYPHDRPTIRAALAAKFGAANVSYAPGVGFDGTDAIDNAVHAADAADVVVLCLGEDAYAETPGNITDLTLPEPQLRLARALVSSGKPIVLVLVEGRPRLIRAIADDMAGVVLAYNPGNEGGQAIADVLAGDTNPSGKLPYTYPRYPNQLLNYDHNCFEDADQGFGLAAYRPQFPFGFGLSYTTFSYSDLTVRPAPAGVPITVTVKVTNAGEREGIEVVQLYLRDVVASVAPPCRRLKRFSKVHLRPQESRTLTFTLLREDLAFIGANGKPTVEPGEFEVHVGVLTGSFVLRADAMRAGD